MIVNIVIIAIAAIFVIFGLRKGFIKWMTVTLGIIIGFWFASKKYLVLEKFLTGLVHSQEKAHIIGFFLIFLLFFFLVLLIGYLLSKVVNLALLGWLDRILGAIFGLFAGLIFVWLLLAAIITVLPSSQPQLVKSSLASRILEIGQRVSGLPLYKKISKKYLTLVPKTLLFIPTSNLPKADL